MRIKTLILSLFLWGCVSVEYDYQILEPGSSSSFDKHPIGYGPFKELIETYSLKSKDVFSYPYIPLNAISKFKSCYGNQLDGEEVYALFNSTISFGIDGYGCEGGVLTNKGLHVNTGSLGDYAGAAFIPYSTLYARTTVFKTELGMVINDRASLDLETSKPREITNIFLVARQRSQIPKYQNIKIEKPSLTINQLPDKVFDFFNTFPTTDFYAVPNIPSNKEKSFRQCARLDEEIPIYVLFDATFFGTGNCFGAAFTDKGIYFRNPWTADYPGIYFLNYDQLLLDEFSPYLATGTQYGEVFIAPGVSFNMGESNISTGNFIKIFRGLRGEENISDEEAKSFVNNFNPIPTFEGKQQQSSVRRQEKAKNNNGISWSDVGFALLGIAVAAAIYDAVDDDNSKPAPRRPSTNRKNQSSTELGLELLQRQQKINSKRARQQRNIKTLELLTNTNTSQRNKGDTMTAYLYERTLDECVYREGSRTYRLDKGIGLCPNTVKVPVGGYGLFDANQMGYSSPSSLKTTWYLNETKKNACVYRYGVDKRTLPKGLNELCPFSYDF